MGWFDDDSEDIDELVRLARKEAKLERHEHWEIEDRLEQIEALLLLMLQGMFPEPPVSKPTVIISVSRVTSR